jgi:Protein kinase domain
VTDRNYDLIARLGRGGMGVVDLARDEDGNKVALKRLTLQGSAAEIARARERLLREAAVLRKLHHPNVVALVDVIDEGDEIVLVMPYMSGGSLAERVAQHGPAPADEVDRQARRLVGALSSAHQAGIVHRDIKPANILFDERGEPSLADFGVALSHDQTHGLTVAGMVVGTPGFMAPEQARGEPVTPATDVFSLGATLLFAATGDGPYGQGDPSLLMVRAASGKVGKVPKSLPGSLRRLLRSMLDPRPERRPTAAAIADGRPVAAGAVGASGSGGSGVGAGGEPTGQGHGWAGGPAASGGTRSRHLPAASRRAVLIAGACVGAAALVAAGIAVASGRGGQDDATLGVDSSPGASECVDEPYQPCGADPAPHTDGRGCIDDHADYDGDSANGCEAGPDAHDGEPLIDRIDANIVPTDDVDTYPMPVEDNLQLLCDGFVEVRLDAPPGMALELGVLLDDALVGQATSADGAPAIVMLGEQQCGGDDAGTFEVVVRPVDQSRVAADYVLTRTGSL